MGFLRPESLKTFQPIENSARFRRSLNQLDKVNGYLHVCIERVLTHPVRREFLKIGLIYVKEGQEDQRSIFRNDSCSLLYSDFVAGLGWIVRLA